MIQFCSRFVIPRIRVVRVPKGRRGTIVSAGLIANLIRDGARDFYVRQRAIQIFREAGAPPKDRWAEVCALFHWVRNNVRYTRDIFRVELLHTPRRMLELRAGDCDDMTILLGAMLVSTGHPVPACVGWFPEETAALIQPHLPRGERAGKMDCPGPHHEPANRLGASHALEANLPRMKASLTSCSRLSEALIKLVTEHSPFEVSQGLAATHHRGKVMTHHQNTEGTNLCSFKTH